MIRKSSTGANEGNRDISLCFSVPSVGSCSNAFLHRVHLQVHKEFARLGRGFIYSSSDDTGGGNPGPSVSSVVNSFRPD